LKVAQKFTDVGVDRFYRLREGDAKLTPVERKPFAYQHLPEPTPRHQ